jgi:oligosaccharide repeat unit polymerase
VKQLGLKTLIIAFLFWYGIGYLHPLASETTGLLEVNLSIGLFILLMTTSYQLGYRYKATITPEQPLLHEYGLGARSFFLIFAVVGCGTVIATLLNGSGMLGYHALRANSALGILAYVYSLLFTGTRHKALLILVAIILVMSLGTYSRRPFLTIMAAMVLIPLIRNRYPLKSILPLALGIALAGFFAIAYITGIRYAGADTSPFALFSLISEGMSVMVRGEGFDTIFLTHYVIETYDTDTYFYGQTFLGGIFNFIPRGLWPDKPIAFGLILSAQYFNIALFDLFTNFGPGIVAEAYANGGYIAVGVIATLLGYLIGRADKAIENGRYDWNMVLFAVILYPALFFMIRGDFLNSFYEFYSKYAVIFTITAVLGLRHRLSAPKLAPSQG